MTEKQKRFCDEYLIDCKAVAAYHRAGYKKSKNSRVDASKLLNKPEIKEYIAGHLEAMQSERIADIVEVLQYLTSVMRGEAQAEVVVIEGVGGGCSQAITMMKHPDESERIRAAELLGKRYGLFRGNVEFNEPVQIIISGDLED